MERVLDETRLVVFLASFNSDGLAKPQLALVKAIEADRLVVGGVWMKCSGNHGTGYCADVTFDWLVRLPYRSELDISDPSNLLAETTWYPVPTLILRTGYHVVSAKC